MNPYHKALINIFISLKNHDITMEEIEKTLNSFDPTHIYSSDDLLLSDAYFSLKHFIAKEEPLTYDEIDYFLECLTGKRSHSFENKMDYLKTTKQR